MARKPNPSKAPALTKALRTAPGDSAVARVARAAEALRRGEWVRIAGQRDVFASAVETAPPATLAQSALLLLTHNRARTLKIRLYTPDIVALKISREADPATLRAIADPTGDLAFPLKGPFEVLREALPAGYAASVALVKLAGLLPADPAAVEAVAKKLRLSNKDAIRLDDIAGAREKIVSYMSVKEQRKLLYRIGIPRLRDRIFIKWAEDPKASNAINWRMLLEVAATWPRPQFPLTGRDVMLAGVPQGPLIGKILEEVEDWWVDADFIEDEFSLAERLKAVVQATAY